jgi:hypothetical protein
MPKSRQRKKKAVLSTSKLPPLPAFDPAKLEALYQPALLLTLPGGFPRRGISDSIP